MKKREEVEALAAYVHGALAFGHALAAIFNWKRGNRKQAAFHLIVAGVDTYAATQHGGKP